MIQNNLTLIYFLKQVFYSAEYNCVDIHSPLSFTFISIDKSTLSTCDISAWISSDLGNALPKKIHLYLFIHLYSSSSRLTDSQHFKSGIPCRCLWHGHYWFYHKHNMTSVKDFFFWINAMDWYIDAVKILTRFLLNIEPSVYLIRVT